MKLSDASIGRFKELAQREGLVLSDDEAREYAGRILTLVQAVMEDQPQRERGPP